MGLPVLMLPTTLLHLLVLNGLGGADPFAVLPRPAALISSSVEFSVGVRNSEKIALGCPVMPIANGLVG